MKLVFNIYPLLKLIVVCSFSKDHCRWRCLALQLISSLIMQCRVISQALDREGCDSLWHFIGKKPDMPCHHRKELLRGCRGAQNHIYTVNKRMPRSSDSWSLSHTIAVFLSLQALVAISFCALRHWQHPIYCLQHWNTWKISRLFKPGDFLVTEVSFTDKN